MTDYDTYEGPFPDDFVIGFASALLFAQAFLDREGGRQTLETHLPRGLKPARLTDAINELDEEAGIVAWRVNPTGHYDEPTIEIGGSEGYFGMPDWT